MEIEAPFLLLGDFGAATLMDQSNSITTVIFQPPELFLCTARWDAWGIGTVIDCMAHHKEPQRKRNAMQLLEQEQGKTERETSAVTGEQRDSVYLASALEVALALQLQERPSSLQIPKEFDRGGKG